MDVYYEQNNRVHVQSWVKNSKGTRENKNEICIGVLV